MPLRIQDASACLVQELLCLENGGYTILRNLLAAYQITRRHNAAGRYLQTIAAGRSPAEIVGSNPTGSMDICLL